MVSSSTHVFGLFVAINILIKIIGEYALAVYWRQQENPNEFESFVLHVKNSEQYAQWETAITKLMVADQKRREMRDKDRHSSTTSRRHISAATNFLATPASEGPMTGPLSAGGYFERELGSNGWDEDGGTPSTSANSTPYMSRRTLSNSGMSRAPDRYSNTVLSARSSQDDSNGMLQAQWRSQQGAVPVPPVPYRNSSDASIVTEASFGNPSSLPRSSLGRGGIPPRMARVMSDDSHGPALPATPEMHESGQEVLRNAGTESGSSRHINGAVSARLSNGSHSSAAQSPSLRMRSASSPNVYQLPRINGEVGGSGSPAVNSASPLGTHEPRTVNAYDYGDPNESRRGADNHQAPAKPWLTSAEYGGGFKSSSNRGSGSTEGSDASSHSPKTPFEGQVPDSAKIASGMFTGSSTDVAHAYKNVIVKVISPNVSLKLSEALFLPCQLMFLLKTGCLYISGSSRHHL
jgi:cell division control protein 24